MHFATSSSLFALLLVGNAVAQTQDGVHGEAKRQLQPGTHIIQLDRRNAVNIFTQPNGVFAVPAARDDYNAMNSKWTVTLANAYSNLAVNFQHFSNPNSGAIGRNLTYVAVAAKAYQAALAAANQTVANVTGLLNTTALLPNAPLTSLNGTLNATSPLTLPNATVPLSNLPPVSGSPQPAAPVVPAPIASVVAAAEAAPSAIGAAVQSGAAAVAHAVDGLSAPALDVAQEPASNATALLKRAGRDNRKSSSRDRARDGRTHDSGRRSSSRGRSSRDRGSSDRHGRTSHSNSKAKPANVADSASHRGSSKSKPAVVAGAASGPSTEAVPLEKTTVTNLVPFLNGNMWAGGVTIGSPAQKLTVTFDTGSADLVVASTACPLAACLQKAQYNAASSQTAQALGHTTFTNTYGDGSVTTGNVYTDVVQVGDLSVKSQAVNAATSISGLLATIPTDGLLGLAFPYLSSTGQPGFFTQLVNNRILAAPQFGLRMSVTGVSELFLGGTDSHQYTGAIEWHDVQQYRASGRDVYAYWALSGGSAFAAGKKAAFGKTFIIDSGTALIYAPNADAAAFYAQIPGAGPCTKGVCAGSNDLYQFPCKNSNDAPNVSFSIGNGRQISLGSTFNLGLIATDANYCVGAVLSGSLGPTGTEWLLGAVFMQHSYSAFDSGAHRVGFATLS